LDGQWGCDRQRYTAYCFITLVILIFAALPLMPMINGWYWPSVHEDVRYAVLVDYFTAAFREGFLYPRWLPELTGGYGYPLFVFYQPGYFFLALPFDLLFDDPMISSGMALLVLVEPAPTACVDGLAVRRWLCSGHAFF
jgi:hypothetical protein